jgi:hypothetical protein
MTAEQSASRSVPPVHGELKPSLGLTVGGRRW